MLASVKPMCRLARKLCGQSFSEQWAMRVKLWSSVRVGMPPS
jgi:hypothetical protein